MTYHTEGIILKREPWRETGRIYTIYTREAGKLMAIGRGTRKILSKLAAHVEPYSTVDLFLAHGPRYETLCGANMTRSPEPLVADDVRYVITAFVAETADQLIKFGEKDEELWGLLSDFYERLAVTQSEDLSATLAGFLWRLMDQLGYGPLLDECEVCEAQDMFDGVWFLPVSGTITCKDCRSDERMMIGAGFIDIRALKELREFMNDTSKHVVDSPAAISSVRVFLEVHLDRPLVSLPILKGILPVLNVEHKL